MQRQTMIALGIALVLGLVAVYLANIFLTGEQQQLRADDRPQAMAKVAVAAVPLDFGVEITPEKVKFVDYPAASIPPGSFSNISQLIPGGKRRVAIRPMLINEPILAAKLTGEGQGASLAAVLPDGKRAAAVRVNDVSGVAGFIQPNDAVDVLITRQITSGSGQSRQVTDVLLQNTKVLAIDQNAKDANGQPVLARTATLEVDPLDAQKLALAQQVGQLSLVLRKPGEQDNTPMVQTVSLENLRYSLYGRPVYAAASVNRTRPRVNVASAPRRTAPQRSRRTAPAAPQQSNVEVVRGTAGSKYEVGGYGS